MSDKYADIRSGRIPLAREELLALADDLKACGIYGASERLREIVTGLMYRVPSSKPRARVKQRKITAELIEDVLAFYRKHPLMHAREIGARFDIDGGRVSEIINGLRTAKRPELSEDRK